jgi:hypothetical protein
MVAVIVSLWAVPTVLGEKLTVVEVEMSAIVALTVAEVLGANVRLPV